MIHQQLSVDSVRAQFPALSSGFAYLENAGGSQVPRPVATAVMDHMLNDYVQVGAGYGQSKRATQIVADAHQFAAELVNSSESGSVFLGPSTTGLIHMIAKAYGETIRSGDEIVIAETNHEANAGAWADLERLGASVKIWRMNRESFICEVSDLEPLLSERTRLVAMPHVSNLIGRKEDVRRAADLVHSLGGHLCVDGVAYAPHGSIDVQELDADWYVFSAYKVYGPHMAVLYGKNSVLKALKGPNHGFIPNDSYPYKWEPGGISHEACAGFVAFKNYLGFLADSEYSGRQTVESAFREMNRLEKPVEARLRGWLAERTDLTLIGPKSASESTEGTVSFVHHRLASDAISAAVDREQIGIRHGNMYAVRILDALGILREPGVVRVSAVHYNTVDEIEKLIDVLERDWGR